jgi:hypothetical protein
MTNWNVVVSVHEHGWKPAFRILQGFGAVKPSDFHNIFLMQVGQIDRFLETFQKSMANDPARFACIARVMPVTCTFTFQTPAEFESKAREAVLQWVPQLGSTQFHVRMHRRGFKGKLASVDEEHFLDKVLLEALAQAGTPGHITFEDPDAVVVVETLGSWCGLSCWTHEQLQQYPFLKVD